MISGVCPKRFRIICEEAVFVPRTVEIAIQGDQLQVYGLAQRGVSVVPFKKIYQLPHYVMPTKYTTLFTEHGHLIIELPILKTEQTYPGMDGRMEGLGTGSSMQPEVDCITVGMLLKGATIPHGMSKYNKRMDTLPSEDYSLPSFWSKRGASYPGGTSESRYWDESAKLTSPSLGYKTFGL